MCVEGRLSCFGRPPCPVCGSIDPLAVGNGSIVRLALVPLFFRQDPEAATHCAAKSSKITCSATAAVDSCRYLAALFLAFLAGTLKADLLALGITPVPDLWRREPLFRASLRWQTRRRQAPAPA